MSALKNVTADALLKKVTSVLTNIPKKELKQFFVRHSALAGTLDSRQTVADWSVMRREYEEFQKTFVETLDQNENYRRIFVQMVLVVVLMKSIDPENDQHGLFAGCALYVSEWSSALGKVFFPKSHPLTFYSLWSSFMQLFNIPWEYHGTSGSVLSILAGNYDEDNHATLLFPGAGPKNDGTADFESWSTIINSLSKDVRESCQSVFGYSGKLHGRQLNYFNPADVSFGVFRNPDKCWAFDLLAKPEDVLQFEQDEEEDTSKYVAEKSDLTNLLSTKTN